MRRSKKKSLFIKIVNTIALTLGVTLGLIFFLIAMENEKEQEVFESKSLYSVHKKETMMSKEQDESQMKKPIYLEDLEDLEKVVEIDPELDYAIKLFEKRANKGVNLFFKKPFNYVEDSHCMVAFNLSNQTYKIKECNSDAIYKRALVLALEETMPIERITYNKINLKNEKLLVKISTN